MSQQNNSSNEAQLLRGALTPTFIVGIIAIGFATALRGDQDYLQRYLLK